MRVDPKLQALSPAELAELLNIDRANEPLWSTSELSEILCHQLDVPLERGMLSLVPTDVAQIASLRQSASPPVTSMRSLLEHPVPPMPLLELVKDFAKECRNHPERGLPIKISTAIYLACIARSITSAADTITSLEPGDLLEGFQWLVAQEWADSCVRIPAQAAAALLQE
jgi:hypothetical protein